MILPGFEHLVNCLITKGTGTFGRVQLCKFKDTERFYALKMLSKLEIVRMKQVQHIIQEKDILSRISFPFIVNLYGSTN
jgi:protein kinase X